MDRRKISVREVTKKYNAMIEMMANEPENDNLVNIYICSTGHKTVTKDVDKGVTPFMHECDECGKLAKSSMYQVRQDSFPTQEWYRPTLKQCLKMRKKENAEALLDHIFQGGLEIRKINKL